MKKLAFIILFLFTSFCFSQTIDDDFSHKINLAQKLTKSFIKKEQIPGMSISVSKNGKLIWSEGFGFSNIEKKKRVNPGETQFRIASISKSLSAYALAKLVDDKKIKLNNSLYSYLPDYPKKKYDFSLKQVGGHLAGIRHYKGKELMSNEKMTITKGLNIFKNDSLLFKPGNKYRYSTYGWNLLSEVIQSVASKPFNNYITETIFNPLKMNNTSLDFSDMLMKNRTEFYLKNKSKKIIIAPKVSNEHKAAGGGFVSTSEDLILFGNEVIQPKLLEKESLNELLTPQFTSNGKSTNYGIGFAIRKTKNGTPKIYHTGGGIGATTLLSIYPKEKAIIVYLINLSQVKTSKFIKDLEAIFIN